MRTVTSILVGTALTIGMQTLAEEAAPAGGQNGAERRHERIEKRIEKSNERSKEHMDAWAKKHDECMAKLKE
jgi:hypothetical protein